MSKYECFGTWVLNFECFGYSGTWTFSAVKYEQEAIKGVIFLDIPFLGFMSFCVGVVGLTFLFLVLVMRSLKPFTGTEWGFVCVVL